MFDDRDDEEVDGKRQREDDARAFALYFRPNYDFRRLIHTDIDAITSFLSQFLDVAHWNLPTDNAGIERALKQAVAAGKLVPIVNRDRCTPAQTFQPTPAPLRWSPSGGGSGQARSAYLFPPGTTSFNGEPVLSGPYDPASQATQLAALRGASSDAAGSGFDWLGVAGEVAGTVAGAMPGGNDCPDDGLSMSFLDDSSTPLGNAQPFELGDVMLAGDKEQLVGMPFNGVPGSWASSMPGTMPQLRQYGPNGTPMTDIDFETHHGNANPHVHNWDGTNRDHGWPVSILP
ncbi:hypothetical protein CY652_19190 [Burkholderia sp. WAC0059]|nr:hypothetical protein CY652_19190 [Burkholderia sp. WAC0059]